MSTQGPGSAVASRDDWWALFPAVVAMLSPLLCLLVMRATANMFLVIALLVVLVVTIPVAYSGYRSLRRSASGPDRSPDARLVWALRAFFTAWLLALGLIILTWYG